MAIVPTLRRSLGTASLALATLLGATLGPPTRADFLDVTAANLPAVVNDSYGFASADIDGDGQPDLVVAAGGEPRVLINAGGAFVDASATWLPTLTGNFVDAALGDVDGANGPDLLLANADGGIRLLINAAGGFSDASGARLPALSGAAMGVALADVDDDGDLDAAVAIRGGRNRLLLNDGSGVFGDASATRLPVDMDPSLGVLAEDLDGDGAPDLFFANDGAQDRLLLNNRLGAFSDATARLPVAALASHAAAAADLDGDGDTDLAVAAGAHGLQLLAYDGATFVDAGAGLPTMADFVVAVAALDADFDGDVDLSLANLGQDRILFNDGHGHFSDVTAGQLPAAEQRSFGIAGLDADADRDAELLLAVPQGQDRYLANILPYPRIRLTMAPDYVEGGDTVTFGVDAFDEDGVDGASVSLEVEYPDGVTRDGVTLAGGTGSYTLPAGAGEYTAIASAADAGGNAGETRLRFQVFPPDVTAPSVSLTLDAPSPLLVGHAVDITVTASDDRGVSVTRLLVDGNPVPLDSSGQATFVTTATGLHTVTAEAEDAAGNLGSAADSFTVGADDEAPALTVDATPAVVDLLELVSIQATASDNVRVATLTALLNGPGIDPPGQALVLDASGHAGYQVLLPGDYTVDVTAADPSGNATAASAAFQGVGEPDTEAPQVTLGVEPRTLVEGDSVTLTVEATDNIAITERALAVNGITLTLDGNGQAVYTPPGLGDYTAVATAADPSGNQATDTQVFSVVDPAGDTDPPVVAITGPAEDVEVVGVVDIVGSVQDPTLVAYRLAYAPVESSDFVEFASGDEQITDGVLGAFDTTLLEGGFYTVRLTATDINGRSASVEQVLNVGDDLKLGLFQMSFTDKTLAVGRFPVSVVRKYDTRRRGVSGDFGYGWEVSLSEVELTANRLAGAGWQQESSGGFIPTYFLTPRRPHLVTIKFGEDEKQTFSARPSPESQQLYPITYLDGMSYEPLGDSQGTLVATGSDPFYFDGGDIYDFGFDIYNPSGFVYTAPDGFRYTFTGSQLSVRYRLIQVTDPSGLTVTLSPGGFQRSDGLGVSFVRDGQGRISEITDPRGNSVRYEYDAAGDLRAVIDAEDNRTEFDYDGGHYLTEVRDPLGRPVQRQDYDEDGRLVGITDGKGNRVDMEYDLDNNAQIVRDRRGNPTIYEYDGRGNVTRQTDFPTVDGATSAVLTLREHDENGQLAAETDGLGVRTEFEYDNRGNVTRKVVDVGGLALEETWTYDSAGRVLTYTDARGNTHTNTYDGQGHKTSQTDRAGHTQTWEYNADGRVVRMTDPNGDYTVFEYDPLAPQGNVAAEERYESDGTLVRRVQFTYDANGNKLTESVLEGGAGSAVVAVTTWEYDANDREVKRIDPEAGEWLTEYDPVGNKSAEVNPLGQRSTYAYDELGNLTRIDYPDGTATLHEYDLDGNRAVTVDRNGQRTEIEYDALDRPTRVAYPDSSEKQTRYDAGGNVTAEIDENGRRTDHTYDAAGRRLTTLQPEVQDAVSGDPVRPLTVYEYDANGNRTAVVDANGRRTEYEFDGEDRQTVTRLPGGLVTSVAYDGLGNVVGKTDAAGLTTTFEYDALKRQTRTVLPPPEAGAPAPETAYAYDVQDNLVSQTDANGHVTLFEYDGNGNRTARELPEGQRETMVYDAAGRMTSHTDLAGDTHTFVYDPNGRVTRATYADGSAVETAYSGEGQRLSVAYTRPGASAAEQTLFEYDPRNRLTKVTQPDGTELSYGYDAVGNRTRVTGPAGSTQHTYDALDRLASVQDIAAGVTAYGYDPVGNLVSLVHPNGVETLHTYNARNQLTAITTRDSVGAVLASYAYTLDDDGLRTRVEELDGSVVTYAYDDNLRLTAETRTGTGAYAVSYEYDAVGNRTRMVRGGVTTDYTYDTNDRLLSAGAVTYAYDPRGNRTARSEAGQTTTYGYDSQGRLSVSQAPDGVVTTYRYDADGNRVAKSDTTGTAVEYLVDAASTTGVSQVLEERDAGGTLLASYTYGHDLLSQDRGGLPSYYHYDGNGNTRALSDDTEALTDTYVYDAYGELVAGTGTTTNAYRYAGERFDPNVGLYHLRARYYDTATGRFVSMDPAMGDPQSPVSLHRYLYANDNPVNFVDPTGKFSLISVSISISIQTNIRSIYTVNLVKFFFKAAKIAFCQLQPAYEMQAIGLEMIFSGLPGGELLVAQARQNIAAGYRAIGKAIEGFYQNVANDVFTVKVEVSGLLKDLYDAATSGQVNVPVPEEIQKLQEFRDKLDTWLERFSDALAAVDAASVGDSCKLFTILDKQADFITGLIPSF